MKKIAILYLPIEYYSNQQISLTSIPFGNNSPTTYSYPSDAIESLRKFLGKIEIVTMPTTGASYLQIIEVEEKKETRKEKQLLKG